MRPAVTLSAPWRFPTPEIHQLPNGLTVWAFHLPGQHVIAAELVLAAGVSAEPVGLEGLATVALRVCDEGTLTHPDGRINELLDDQGALIDSRQGHYTAQLRLEVPGTRLLAALPLFASLVREPQSATRDVRQQIDLLIADHEQRLASPRGATSLAFRRALYADHDRRTTPEAGTPHTLARITTEDVLAYQHANWGPTGAVLVLAGDLPDGTLAAIEDAFAGWAPTSPHADVPPQPRDRPLVVCVDRPGSVQADAVIGAYAVGRTDPRLPAAVVAGQIMAGAFTSRLNLALREDRGYSYGIGGGFSPGRYGGVFQVAGSFRTEVAADAIALALDHLRLRDSFTPTEVAAAQAYLLGVAPLANETALDIADQAVRLADGRVGVDYLHRLNDTIATLDADTVSATYRELVRPEGLCLAVTGQADVLVPTLAARGIDVQPIALN